MELGKDESGQRRQKSRSFDTKAQAQRALRDMLHELDRGRDPFPRSVTCADFFVDWLREHESALRPNVAKRYRHFIEHNALPALGGVELRAVKPVQIRQLLRAMRERGLAPRTVNQCRAVLRAAFSRAVADGLIPINPISKETVPPVPTVRPKLTVPEGPELAKIREAAAGTIWEIPILLSATTGLRRGEVLGLSWEDVDLTTSRLTVRQALRHEDGAPRLGDAKTENANRIIALPLSVVERLRRHRFEQAQRRLSAGSAWQDWGLVCDRGDGAPFNPDAFSHAVKRLLRRIGLPNTRLHDLRHGVATVLLDQRVPLAVASAVLGHSSPAFTAKTYQHVRDRMVEEAASAIESALGG